MKYRVASFALVLLGSAAGASAQVVYKSTMPDGRVVYSEKPDPGARRVDRIEPPPAKTGTTLITPEEVARAENLARERATATAAKQGDLDDARKQLQQAQAARDAGKEPLPGERSGTAGGASRLTEAYHTRQKALEDALTAARKRVEETSRGR